MVHIWTGADVALHRMVTARSSQQDAQTGKREEEEKEKEKEEEEEEE